MADEVVYAVEVGPVEVSVVAEVQPAGDDEAGTVPLPIIPHQGKLSVVAAEGQHFSIKLRRTASREEGWPSLRFVVHVDGEYIGFRPSMTVKMDTCVVSTYMGAPGTAEKELTRFCFASVPQADMQSPAPAPGPVGQQGQQQPQQQRKQLSRTGTLQIKVEQISVIHPPRGRQGSHHGRNNHNQQHHQRNGGDSNGDRRHHRQAAVPVKKSEEKKFFHMPSLQCGGGASAGFMPPRDVQGGNRPIPIKRKEADLGTLTLSYDTATTLLLRGVLKPAKPTHAAILQERGVPLSPLPPPPPLPPHMQGAAGASSAAADPQQQLQPRSGRRSRSGAGAEAAAADGPDVIDLTGEGLPLIVQGQVVQGHRHVATCDLTGTGDSTEDDESGEGEEGGGERVKVQPVWRLVERVKEEVVVEEAEEEADGIGQQQPGGHNLRAHRAEVVAHAGGADHMHMQLG